MSGRPPSFLVIGAARSGTTYLSRALNLHPLIAVTTPKEPNFLAFGGTRQEFAGPGDERTRDSVVGDEHEWRALFDACDGVVVGEASVTTMFYPEVTVPRIQQFCPDARLIAVLRAPWDRARSAWMLLRGQGRETLSFADGLVAEPARIASGFESIWHYRSQSEYARQLRPFVDAFGDRLLVLEFERMVSGADELERAFAHLGVEAAAVPDLGRVNEASDPHFAWLRRRMATAHARPTLRRAMRAVVPASARRSILDVLAVGDRDEPLPDGFVASFEADLADLRRLLGDQTPRWARPR